MRVLSELVHHWLAPVITVVLGIAALLVGWLSPAINESREASSRLALERAASVEAEVDHVLTLAQTELAYTAELLSRNPERRDEILTRLMVTKNVFGSIAVVEEDGIETFRASTKAYEAIGIGGRVHFLESYFAPSLEGKEGLGAVEYAKDGAPVIPVIHPLHRGDGARAFLVADLVLEDVIDEARLNVNGGAAFVTNDEGTIIAHPDPEVSRERRNMLLHSGIQKVIIAGEAATGLSSDDGYTASDGTAMFLAGVPMREGWGAFVEQPKSVAFAGERKIELLSVAFSALGLAFFFFMWQRERDNEKIIRRNQQLLTENQASARMLIFKDRELHESNDYLERMNAELSNSARFLVQRDLELSHANSRLEELDAIKSEFVSVAAHQLRTPLTGVRWSLKALSSGEYGKLTDGQQKVANDALWAIVGAINLINDLLNVARIEGGRFGFSFVDQPVVPLLNHIINLFGEEAARRGIALSLDNKLPADLHMFYDAEKINMAFENVVGNAIAYTPSNGSVTISAALEATHAVFTVKDTGIGIPKAEMHRLFTKFFRAQNAILVQTSGTGLGLYLVKNIIEKHKGTVSVTSEEGKGTTVTFVIPVNRRIIG